MNKLNGRRRILIAVLVLAAPTALIGFTMMPSEAATAPVTGGVYQLASAASGKCVDVTGASADNSALLIQTTCSSTATNQQWKVQGADQFNLVNGSSGRCIDVPSGSTTSGTQLQQYGCGDGTKVNQLWTVTASTAASGKYLIRSAVSGLCISNKDGSTAGNNPIVEETCSDIARMQWSYNYVSGPTTSPTTGVITSGAVWKDNNGNPVNAHGGGMIKVGGTYYWIGEYKGVDNSFVATACYSSTDLQHWTFVNNTLEKQASGDLGPNRVVERPKILYNKTTNMYVQTMHVDDLTYDDEAVGVATSSTVCGDYTYQGRLKYNGSTVKYWDSGSFQDSDGTGYVITHNGNIFQLATDYLSAVSKPLSAMCSNCESPALFKVGGTYYFLFSHRTGWATNDNFYFTATSLAGPWTSRGNLAPSGQNTWNSQTTYVLPIQGTSTTTYMFMGDRWNATNLGTSTYVWQPLVVSGTSLSMPTFHASWTVDTATGKATY